MQAAGGSPLQHAGSVRWEGKKRRSYNVESRRKRIHSWLCYPVFLLTWLACLAASQISSYFKHYEEPML